MLGRLAHAVLSFCEAWLVNNALMRKCLSTETLGGPDSGSWGTDGRLNMGFDMLEHSASGSTEYTIGEVHFGLVINK